MKTTILKLTLFFSILLTFGFQCGEEEQYSPIYELELPFQVLPAQKEYKINDTISIRAIINDKSLKDLKTQNLIEIKCTDIPIEFSVIQRDIDLNPIDTTQSFDVIIDSLNFPNPQLVNKNGYLIIETSIAEDIINKEDIGLLKLVPKKKGIYMMDPFHYQDIYVSRAETCNTTDPLYDSGIMSHLFLVADIHPELADETPLPSNIIVSGGNSQQLIDEKRVFFFKVVE